MADPVAVAIREIADLIKARVARHPVNCAMSRSFDPVTMSYLGCDCGMPVGGDCAKVSGE